jgi:DNA mismatch repair protein MutS2
MFSPPTLKTLDFFALLEIVAQKATSEPGRKAVLELRPRNQLEEVEKSLGEVREAIVAEEEGDLPSMGDLEDILPLLEKARPQGAILLPEELLKIKKQLLLASRVREALGQRDQAPLLSSQVQKLHLLEDLRNHLDRVISPYGEVLDSASPKLEEIRLRKENLRREIRERLQQLLATPHLSQAFQERTITLRNGRYVVPIKAQFSGKVKGLVQDQSATGSTLYVEPFSVVELNNRLIRSEKEEEQEIERILRECTGHVRTHSGTLKRNQAILAHLDSLGARARFALEYRASVPRISREPTWNILECRHPLLIKEKGLEGTCSR